MKLTHWIVLGLCLSAPALADPPGYTRKNVTLTATTSVGGLEVAAGQIEVFEPGETLARGTLAQGAPVQQLDLPAGSALNFESPGRLASVDFPRDEAEYTIAGYPFAGGGELSFGYGEFLAHMRGKIADRPDRYPGFPTAGLNPDAFVNDSTAICTLILEPRSNGGPRQWTCDLELVLEKDLPQSFGAQSLTIPSQTLIDYGKGGISTLQLAHDAELMGLPVSASAPIRLAAWTQDSPQSISSLTLSHDARYAGIPLSAMGEVDFYPLGDANPKLMSFVPSDGLWVGGEGKAIILAPLQIVELNEDGSLRRGVLGSPQPIIGALFPAGAEVFFGDRSGAPLSSARLDPFASVTIDGVVYGDTFDEAIFIDFDENGHVIRVR